jgi:hypothetical protein
MSPGPSKDFSVSYDTTTKIVSAIVVAGLALVAVVVQNIYAGCLSLLIIALAFAYSPRGYTVSDRSITVKRLAGNVQVLLENVREARRINADDLRGCIRLWGSGGLFGYYGLFRTTSLGRSTWYVTNRKNAVVVMAEGTTLYSPDDVDGFLAAIQTCVRGGIGPAGESFPARRPVGVLIGVIAAVGAAAAAIFAVLYSPGPPSYTLNSGSLTIHDRFYPVTVTPDSVDVSNIRVVDLTTEDEWRPTRRTNGFANSHYRSGWFRVGNGATVRLYAADGTRLVLLPPKSDSSAVLMETQDPEGFIQEVRQEWSQ